MAGRFRLACVVGSAVGVSALFTAGPAAGAPACETAQADGFEPPCNPHLASQYSNPHGSYAQDSTRFRGPERPADVRRIVTGNAPFVPIGAGFSAPYSDGRRAIWAPGISTHQDSAILKLDEQTAQLIDIYTRETDEGTVPEQAPPITRVYGVLTRDNIMIRAAGPALDVVGDERPGERTSPLKLIKRFQLPPRALCRADDGVVGVEMRYDGNIAFVTIHGVVGIIPSDPARMTDENLVVHSINGARCDDPSIPLEQLETSSNSLVADNRGAIYPLTNRALHKFVLRDARLVEKWRMPYQTGTAEGGGVRLDQGSGSTPTLMGTRREHDRFVVFTDGQKVMHLVLAWRDEIPRNWQGLPNRDRRIACEHPVTYGDPNIEASSSEQSVVVRRYASFLPNNELRNVGAFGLVPLPQTAALAIGGLFGQFPTSQPFGFERIDWDPQTRSCRSVWANRQASFPNGVPYASAGSGLVYGIAARDGQNGLMGLDIDTGQERLWVPSGAAPTQNAFFSALNLGPDGSAWTGGFGGFTKFEVGRPEQQFAPAVVRLRVKVLRRKRLRGGRARVVVRVRGEDLADGRLPGVRGVRVRIGRGRARRTNRRGIARLKVRAKRGYYTTRAAKRGFEPGVLRFRLCRLRRTT
jgi:hypothetical protein